MARTPKEAIVIVLDIGRNVCKEPHQDGKTFLELSKSCVMRIIERKIFSKAKDEIGMVLVGSKETVNPLNYRNVSEAFNLTPPSWKMLKVVEDDIVGTNEVGDWLDGVVIAMNVLKIQTENRKFTAKKVVLFTNCHYRVNASNSDTIMKSILDEDIEFTVIGPDIYTVQVKDGDNMDVDNDNNETKKQKEKSEDQEHGESLLAQMMEKTGGILCSFDDAIPQLMFYQKKAVRPIPWNVWLDIGPNIKIPVSGYKKIAHVFLPSWKNASSQDPTIPLENERTYYKKDKSAVENYDRIEGYNFGSTLVPFTDIDKSAMCYRSGNKCLSVLGFTKSTFVPRHLLVGDGTYVFLPQRDKIDLYPAFYALVHSLHDLGLVAIVRKIYNNNNAPHVGALFPKVKERRECLFYVELPFSEDIRNFSFPSFSTESKKPTQDQLNAVELLIQNMDLMNVEENNDLVEALIPKKTLNPYHQHLFNCMAHRALHPKDNLPPVAEEIKRMFNCPFESKVGYQEALKIIQERFKLIEQKPKNPYRRKDKGDQNSDEPVASTSKAPDFDVVDNGNDLADMKMEDLTKPSVMGIGTITPEKDFEILLSKGQPLDEVCSQMQLVIQDLVRKSFGAASIPKALSALSLLRKTCVERNPEPYNKWLPDFKEMLYERGKDAFWDMIGRENLGLITREENSTSTISVREALQLFDAEEEPMPEPSQIQPIDTDILFNEM